MQPITNYVIDPELNGNDTLTKHGATEYLIDAAINYNDWEWIGAKVTIALRLGKKFDIKGDVVEMAKALGMMTDESLIDDVIDGIKENQQLFVR